MCNQGRAAKRQKEKQVHFKELLACIQSLELLHNKSSADQTLEEFLQARFLLPEELGKVMKWRYVLTQKFYEYGNKSRKLLVRTLQSKQEAMIVHNICDAASCYVVSNYNIESQFVQYYTTLYNFATSICGTL